MDKLGEDHLGEFLSLGDSIYSHSLSILICGDKGTIVNFQN